MMFWADEWQNYGFCILQDNVATAGKVGKTTVGLVYIKFRHNAACQKH